MAEPKLKIKYVGQLSQGTDYSVPHLVWCRDEVKEVLHHEAELLLKNSDFKKVEHKKHEVK